MAVEYRMEKNILWIRGKLDSSAAPEFETALAALADSLVDQPPRAILELSEVRSLTSAPLRAMLTLAKRLRAAHGEVVVAAPSSIALEALKISGFLRLQLFRTITSLAELGIDASSPAASSPAETGTSNSQQGAGITAQKKLTEAPLSSTGPPVSWLGRIRKLLCFWER
jgi:anti-anti-sigma factor